ncbi:MAG TPA: ROK family protein, partial [Acidimicrobiales bacterium]|nr:ROK family protein [Acidimicrobiales bacterium]
EARGVARWAVNLGWRDVDAARLAAEALGLPVWLGHDVRLGGEAEGALGAGRGARDFLFVPIGTGIAAAVVLDGRARRGVDGLAGEIGHFVVAPGGPLCRCGARGCLETLASASALARRYRERKAGAEAAVTPGVQLEAGAVGPDGPAPGVSTPSHSWPDAAGVLALARGGDGVAADIWADAIGHLGRALAVAQSLLDVELIVVGGGLANAGESLLRQVEGAFSPLLPVQHMPRIALAQLGDEAAGLGAALLARSAAVAHASPSVLGSSHARNA